MTKRGGAREAESRRDAGFTLVEVLVVATLLSVVGSVLTAVMISATRSAAWQDERARTLIEARVAMERLTREVRGANSMTAAGDRSLTFVMNAGTVRRQVTLEVRTDDAGTDLVQVVVRDDTADAAPATTTATKLLSGLAVGRSEAVFTYTDGDGVPLAPTIASPPTYEPENVKTVGIRVVMKRAGGNPTELYQLVSIRNLES